ncbi:MAG TPA: tRNA (adenosine(37)-N6)-threonylcarbamoyltransferase complex ATPase subunit type 1 TsaE [Pseudomonadales bacterium]|nr:tRNA (adenosine(37)-N6)-threonylcarbamoyltransferase complex ATPase subunit type 1 TsaE [Pseudomonadales bacterium]
MPEMLLATDADTIAWGEKLGRALAGHGVVYLYGELGAGKTTLCRGILRSYGYAGAVKSPTYTIMEPYELNAGRIFHFDLYRLNAPEEWNYLGFEDFFSEQAICLLEWPQRGGENLPAADLAITLAYREQGRTMKIEALSERGCSVLDAMHG